MIEALHIAATGMQAQQLNVDTIANNLANVNTSGFKKGRVSFSDLMVKGTQAVQPAADGGLGPLAPAALSGAGVGIASNTRMFDAGDMKKTGSIFDIAIQGDGFIEIQMPDGTRAFSRGGTLKVNRDGLLAASSGQPLKPAIQIPDNAQGFTIGADGRVMVLLAGQSTPTEAGQLDLVRFSNSPGLLAQGDGLYRASDASGEAIASRPGEEGAGTFVQGMLEGSNVKMVEEMVNLMVAQRAYEASVKVVQASDEMLGLINGLRK